MDRPVPRPALLGSLVILLTLSLAVPKHTPASASGADFTAGLKLNRCSSGGIRPVLAVVRFVLRGLQAKSSGPWLAVRTGATVRSGTELRTRKEQKAVVDFCRGGTLYINQQSQVELRGVKTLVLSRGEIAAQVFPSDQLHIQAPFGTADGMALDVKAGRSVTIVTTLGVAHVRSHNGSITLKTGQQSRLAKNHAPSSGRPVDLKKARMWLRGLPAPHLPHPTPTATSRPPSPSPTETFVPTSTPTLAVTATPQPEHHEGALFVAPGGVDRGSCLSDVPCASFRYAGAHARPGNVVIVRAGSYGPQLIEGVRGDPTSPILFQAEGTVVLTRLVPADETTQRTALLHILNSSDLVVEGFAIVGMKGRSDYDSQAQPCNPLNGRGTGGEVCVENHGSNKGTGLIFRNNEVLHANNNCIKAQNEQAGQEFVGNIIYDCGAPNSLDLDHAIYVSGPNNTISDNTIHEITGDAVEANGNTAVAETITGNTIYNVPTAAGIRITGTQKGDTSIISRNTVHDTHDAIHVTTNAQIDHNVIFNTLQSAVAMDWSNRSWPSIGPVWIVNNTFYRNTAVMRNTASAEVGDSLTIVNNIFDGGILRGAQLYSGAPASNAVYQHDLYFGVPPPLSPQTDVQAIGADPRFVVPGSDFRLAAQSPAIGAGVLISLPFGASSLDLGALPSTATTGIGVRSVRRS